MSSSPTISRGHRLTSRDRGGHITTYEYDPLGRLSKTIAPDGSFTRSVYDAAGQVIESYDALGHKTSYGYDAAGRRITVTNALNQVTTFAYDAAGNQTSVTDALQRQTQYVYDDDGRRIKTIYPDQSFDSVEYDAAGRQTAKVDQAGKRTDYGYDKLGRLTTVTQYLNQGSPAQQALVTSYSYDELGNRLTQTDANQHTTRFEYDRMGRRLRRIRPLGQAEDYTYDTVGNLKTRTDFNRHTTTYNYDPNNRLISKVADLYFSQGTCSNLACGATEVDYSYTATGKRNTMTDASGTTTYVYDPVTDRLTSRQTPFGTLSYTYDVSGNLGSVSSSNTNGVAVSYGYDDLNRLSTATDAAGPTSYQYDAVGNLQQFAYPNGVTHSYNYNPLNRLTSMVVGTAAETQAGYTYTLGPAGNRISVSELTGRTITYGYDDLYRLTSETIACGTAAPNCSSQTGAISYVYDPVGNRLQLSSTVPAIPAGMLNYDANDRLTTDLYDDNGNTVSSGGIGNVYDFENHLVQHGAVSIIYDGDGNRVQKTAAGVTTSYLVDTNNLTGYAQVVEELQNAAVVRAYTYGLDLISQRQLILSTWNYSYYGYDGHGSVRTLTDSAGSVTDTYTYDAFGNLIERTGSTPNNYLYSGEQFDPDLGLYYNRARYLDVRNGRFWGMDTAEANNSDPVALHRYLYAAADPVDRSDPSGQFFVADFAIASSIASTLNNITAINGQAVMDQLQLGGNSGFKSLLRSTGFIVGPLVVFKTIGGGARYLNAAVHNLNSKSALSRFSRAAEFGILPWKILDKVVPVGSGLHKHHLIEKRFVPQLGVLAEEIPAIALTPGEHGAFTQAWRDAIGYINENKPITTANATLDDIWRAAQKVYVDHPDLLEYVRIVMRR